MKIKWKTELFSLQRHNETEKAKFSVSSMAREVVAVICSKVREIFWWRRKRRKWVFLSSNRAEEDESELSWSWNIHELFHIKFSFLHALRCWRRWRKRGEKATHNDFRAVVQASWNVTILQAFHVNTQIYPQHDKTRGQVHTQQRRGEVFISLKAPFMQK